MRINLKNSYVKDNRRAMLAELIAQLCYDYDLERNHTAQMIKSKKGVEIFIKYLNESGYTVKFYSWPEDDKDPLSYGLEFNESDPLFIALKMKYLDFEPT